MNTDKEEPLYKAESQQIVGSAMEVLNEIGHGFHEKVREYIPDLIAYEKITDREIGQMMNYLEVTGLRLGYILNSSTQSWNGNVSSNEFISVYQCSSVVQNKKPTRRRC